MRHNWALSTNGKSSSVLPMWWWKLAVNSMCQIEKRIGKRQIDIWAMCVGETDWQVVQKVHMWDPNRWVMQVYKKVIAKTNDLGGIKSMNQAVWGIRTTSHGPFIKKPGKDWCAVKSACPNMNSLWLPIATYFHFEKLFCSTWNWN